jgi:dTDP-4-dehydrorhamnose reductase
MSRQKKILITGGAGMLGSAIYPYFKKKGYRLKVTDINLTDAWVSHLDVRDFKAVNREITKNHYDFIFHLAAETDLEKCEIDYQHAFQTNSLGTYNVALCCAQKKIPLVYISTAAVFNGQKKTSYHEYDLPSPISIYGQSKYQGELIIRQLLKKFYIVRAGWMMGGLAKDKKFVLKIIQQLNQGCSKIYAVVDKFGTITYTKSFAVNLELLIQTNLYNTYHMGCLGSASRYEIVKEILKILQLDKKIKLIKTQSDKFQQEYFSTRSASEKIENLNLEFIKLNKMPAWQTALADYLIALKNNDCLKI